MAMNPEWKKKLLEALRSGKYKQCRNRLRSPYGYCCLGVACDISGLAEWEKHESPLEDYYHYEGQDCDLPSKVGVAMGITREEMCRLIELNDAQRYSFAEIADYIEKEM